MSWVIITQTRARTLWPTLYSMKFHCILVSWKNIQRATFTANNFQTSSVTGVDVLLALTFSPLLLFMVCLLLMDCLNLLMEGILRGLLTRRPLKQADVSNGGNKYYKKCRSNLPLLSTSVVLFCSGVNLTEVANSLLAIDGVVGVRHLRIWSLSMDTVSLSVTIAVGWSKYMHNFFYLTKVLSRVPNRGSDAIAWAMPGVDDV